MTMIIMLITWRRVLKPVLVVSLVTEFRQAFPHAVCPLKCMTIYNWLRGIHEVYMKFEYVP